ncbi:MAG: type I-E CRISPR-associated protein Cse2/CasB [Rectinemataceae bacterium]
MSGLLEELRWYRQKDSRGFFANLRCYLVTSKRQKAWPALNRLNVAIGDDVSSFIAAWYATHPEEAKEGNLGTACRLIGLKRGESKSKDDKLTPMERRFQQLLASEKGDELTSRITRFILMAKSQNVPINYEQLRKDISYWNDRTKIEWAQAFWTLDTGIPPTEALP